MTVVDSSVWSDRFNDPETPGMDKRDFRTLRLGLSITN